jgi:hypothetical protein
MLTWARYLLIMSLAAVMIAGPALSAPSLPACCQTTDGAEANLACKTADHACCASRDSGEKPCCRRFQSEPSEVVVSNGDVAACSTCPLDQCGCCQVSPTLTIVCVLPSRAVSDGRVPAEVLPPSDSLLRSRSDEPLLPPPIA